MRSLTGLWTLPDPKCRVVVVSRRVYGQPKLKKPSELSGVSSAFSVDFIAGKCRCQCFIHGDDVYVKHRDFGSTEVYGGRYVEHPSHRQKFITLSRNRHPCGGIFNNLAGFLFRNVFLNSLRRHIPDRTVVGSPRP